MPSSYPGNECTRCMGQVFVTKSIQKRAWKTEVSAALEDNGGNSLVESKRGKLFRDSTIS